MGNYICDYYKYAPAVNYNAKIGDYQYNITIEDNYVNCKNELRTSTDQTYSVNNRVVRSDDYNMPYDNGECILSTVSSGNPWYTEEQRARAPYATVLMCSGRYRVKHIWGIHY